MTSCILHSSSAYFLSSILGVFRVALDAAPPGWGNRRSAGGNRDAAAVWSSQYGMLPSTLLQEERIDVALLM